MAAHFFISSRFLPPDSQTNDYRWDNPIKLGNPINNTAHGGNEMAKILYIKANPKSDNNSVTFKMSEEFVRNYRKENPDDEIITLDLYKEDIRFLNGQDLTDMFSGKDFDIRKYAEEFAQADKYIFSAPLWNLSFPAILKAYIDYITFAGITFKYTANGAVGLLAGQNKKAVYIVARGGDYSQPPMSEIESGERYLRIIMGFLGVADFTSVSCELTNVLQGDKLEKAITSAVERAAEASKLF